MNNTVPYIKNFLIEGDVVHDSNEFDMWWPVAVSCFGLGGLFGAFMLPPLANTIGIELCKMFILLGLLTQELL